MCILDADEMNRDLNDMEDFADRLVAYRKDTAEQCETIEALVNNAVSKGAFSDPDAELAAQRILGWVKAIRAELPEADTMAAALRESAARGWEAKRILNEL